VSAPLRQDPCEVFERYRRSRAPADRELLVQRYTPLARRLAGRYARSREPFDDLFQVACLGLLKAIDGYDERRGAFTSYAVPTILGELKRHFRDKTWVVRVPHRVRLLALAVRTATAEHAQRTGREPTAQALAQALDICEEDVVDALQALAAYDVVSLEAPHGERGRELVDLVGEEDDDLRLIEARAALADVLARLTALEQRALALRFEQELTQRQIADRLGVSQMSVSRLLRRALARLETLAEQRGLSASGGG
jgi:RNA polymerase sigma-B factor